MTRERKQPVIRKPVIDEETALRFAAAVTDPSPSVPPTAAVGAETKTVSGDNGTVEITVSLTRETYARITREAAKKNRSVEDLLQRHLTKHYGKE